MKILCKSGLLLLAMWHRTIIVLACLINLDLDESRDSERVQNVMTGLTPAYASQEERLSAGLPAPRGLPGLRTLHLSDRPGLTRSPLGRTPRRPDSVSCLCDEEISWCESWPCKHVGRGPAHSLLSSLGFGKQASGSATVHVCTK